MLHPPRRQFSGLSLGVNRSERETKEKLNLMINVSNVGGFLKVEELISGSLKKEALNFKLLTAQDGR